MQAASSIFLVKPSHFVFNEETSPSNAFQKKASGEHVTENVLKEFEGAVETLKKAGLNVHVFNDTPYPQKPDAIFPNNWVSLHADGTIVLYPMLAENRRTERRADIIEALKENYNLTSTIDLSGFEKAGRFLEGTGSIVFDHVNKTAYACLSPRTDEGLFNQLCGLLGYQPVSFRSWDKNGQEIYHTNVMMCIGPGFAVICTESITNEEGKNTVLGSLRAGGLEIVEISFSQMENFAGNMLALKSAVQETIIVMSGRAFNSLRAEQRSALEKFGKLLPLSIDTIETIGGGSARCMIAEIFCGPLESFVSSE